MINYSNYQFWIFAVGGGLFALTHGNLWPARPPSTAPYELALAVDPEYALAHYNLGVVAQRAGKLAEARAHYEAAAAADPLDHNWCVNYAQVTRRLGALDEALSAAGCAIEHERDRGLAYDELGQVLMARGDHAAAAQALERALELRPHHTETRVELGAAYAKTSRLVEAEVTLRYAVAENPALAEAWFNLGLVVWKRDATEAYGSFAMTVLVDPRNTKALGNLIFLDVDAGRIVGARYWIDRLLAIDPTHEHALKLRAELAGR